MQFFQMLGERHIWLLRVGARVYEILNWENETKLRILMIFRWNVD